MKKAPMTSTCSEEKLWKSRVFQLKCFCFTSQFYEASVGKMWSMWPVMERVGKFVRIQTRFCLFFFWIFLSSSTNLRGISNYMLANMILVHHKSRLSYTMRCLSLLHQKLFFHSIEQKKSFIFRFVLLRICLCSLYAQNNEFSHFSVSYVWDEFNVR